MPTSSDHQGQKDSPATVIDDISENHVFHHITIFKHILYFFFLLLISITLVILYHIFLFL